MAKGGAADRAGLEDEDIVVEVDGVNVEARPYEDVVGMIRASGSSLVLLVLEQQAYDYFKAQKIPITTLLLSQDHFKTPHTPTSLEEVKEEEEEEEEESDKEEKNEPATLPVLTEARERVSVSIPTSSLSPVAP